MRPRINQVSDKALIHPTPHYVPRGRVSQESLGRGCCALRRGAQRDAGADESFVTNGGGARAGLVLGRFRLMAEMDTYELAV